MPWPYIQSLLGAGLHWRKSREELAAAIAQADKDEQFAAAAHLRIILKLRNAVMADGA